MSDHVLSRVGSAGVIPVIWAEVRLTRGGPDWDPLMLQTDVGPTLVAGLRSVGGITPE
jgi:hypothetical protein